MKYYKATRPDGMDFHTGTVDYGAALISGEVLRHPTATIMFPNNPATYLSVSVEPTGTLIGGAYPCRLFEIEPVGKVMENLRAHPHKRAIKAMRVVRELPSREVFGPHGKEIVEIIVKCRFIGRDQAELLTAARYAIESTVRDAARDAALGAIQDFALGAALGAAQDAAEVTDHGLDDVALGVALGAAQGAAQDAILAQAAKDWIAEEYFDVLYTPWGSLMD